MLTVIHNRFNFPFFLTCIISEFWKGNHTWHLSILDLRWFQERSVEDWMDSQIQWGKSSLYPWVPTIHRILNGPSHFRASFPEQNLMFLDERNTHKSRSNFLGLCLLL